MATRARQAFASLSHTLRSQASSLARALRSPALTVDLVGGPRALLALYAAVPHRLAAPAAAQVLAVATALCGAHAAWRPACAGKPACRRRHRSCCCCFCRCCCWRWGLCCCLVCCCLLQHKTRDISTNGPCSSNGGRSRRCALPSTRPPQSAAPRAMPPSCPPTCSARRRSDSSDRPCISSALARGRTSWFAARHTLGSGLSTKPRRSSRSQPASTRPNAQAGCPHRLHSACTAAPRSASEGWRSMATCGTPEGRGWSRIGSWHPCAEVQARGGSWHR